MCVACVSVSVCDACVDSVFNEVLQAVWLIDGYQNLVSAFFKDLVIFDSGGKDVFSDLCEASWEKIGMFVLVFDVTNSKSFAACQKWLKKLKQYFEPGKTIPGIYSDLSFKNDFISISHNALFRS